MALSQKFAEVILPLALPEVYSYEIPAHLESSVYPGLRVEVPLRNKLYSGIVMNITDKAPTKTKPILSVIDQLPLVTPIQLKFWQWMADYYFCSIGEIMNNAMPSGLKLESETKIIINPSVPWESFELNDDEFLVADAVSIRNELTIGQIQDILQKKSVYPVLKKLLDAQIISIKEELVEKFKPKFETFIKLATEHKKDPNLSAAFALVEKSKKQTDTLLAYAQMSRKIADIKMSHLNELTKTDASTIKAMVQKGIFFLEKKQVSRISQNDISEQEEMPQLTELQTNAISHIYDSFSEQKPCLIHGVTGSGKTRVYAEVIKKTLELQQQVLYLLPEIALTNHIVDRLKQLFQTDILVYHSRMNNQERVEIWNAVLAGAKIVVGARSSIFLPFIHLGLIVVDEEHDPSYKQMEPAPRYHARDAAMYLAKLHKSHVLLGSATPSIESMFNAKSNKYSIFTLDQRYGEAAMPTIQIIDLRKEYKDKRFDGLFSGQLLDEMKSTLDKDKQILIFQNRRGYAPSLHCPVCGWRAECSNCDVHLTLHKTIRELRCHYCNLRSKIPNDCPACGTSELIEQGFGTERIEEAIKHHFHDAQAGRIDLDTAKTKIQFEKILYDFEERRIQILIGTQMITKGIDFDNIGLVAVLNADSLFRFPDFRANERAYQLLTQVAGRAGRRGSESTVIFQTYSPDHPIILETIHQDYSKFYAREMTERAKFIYPPLYRLIHIEIHHKYKEIAFEAANLMVKFLHARIGNRCVGPAPPNIERLRGLYIQSLMIKMEKDVKVSSKIRFILTEAVHYIKGFPNTKSARIIIDIDPN